MANFDLVVSAYDAYARGEAGGILGILDPGIVWSEAESFPYNPGGPIVGGDAIVQAVLVKITTQWEDFQILPRRFTDAGERVVVEGRYTGRYKETDRRIDAQFCHVWDFADGKAVAFQQYTDTAKFRDVMGIA